MPDGRLFIWPRMPKDHPKILKIKSVVESLGLDYGIKPFFYDAASSQNVQRVLVTAAGFEHSPIVDYIRPMKAEQVGEAVRWALGLTDSRGARNALDTMKSIFGEDLTMRIEREGEDADETGEWLG